MILKNNTNNKQLKQEKFGTLNWRRKRKWLQFFFQMYFQAIKSKAVFFFYPFVNKTIKNFLECLEKHSRIAGYQILLKEQKIKIFLICDSAKNTPLSQKVTFYFSRGRKRMATVQMLRQFRYRNPHLLAIIATQNGLMDIQNCISHQHGGEFLLSMS